MATTDQHTILAFATPEFLPYDEDGKRGATARAIAAKRHNLPEGALDEQHETWLLGRKVAGTTDGNLVYGDYVYTVRGPSEILEPLKDTPGVALIESERDLPLERLRDILSYPATKVVTFGSKVAPARLVETADLKNPKIVCDAICEIAKKEMGVSDEEIKKNGVVRATGKLRKLEGENGGVEHEYQIEIASRAAERYEHDVEKQGKKYNVVADDDRLDFSVLDRLAEERRHGMTPRALAMADRKEAKARFAGAEASPRRGRPSGSVNKSSSAFPALRPAAAAKPAIPAAPVPVAQSAAVAAPAVAKTEPVSSVVASVAPVRPAFAPAPAPAVEYSTVSFFGPGRLKFTDDAAKAAAGRREALVSFGDSGLTESHFNPNSAPKYMAAGGRNTHLWEFEIEKPIAARIRDRKPPYLNLERVIESKKGR